MKEYATEDELFECLGEEAALSSFNTGYGWGTRFQEKSDLHADTGDSHKESVVYTYIGNSMMYICENGTTFNRSGAKRFNKTTAENKAKFMSRKGKYQWKTTEA